MALDFDSISHRVKMRRLANGWLFTGIPRIADDPKEIHLNLGLDPKTKKYCVKLRTKIGWVFLDDYRTYYNEDMNCCGIQFENTVSCPICKTIPFDVMFTIENFLGDYFKYSTQRELYAEGTLTWLSICKFRNNFNLPRELVDKIAKLIYYGERLHFDGDGYDYFSPPQKKKIKQ